MARSATVDPLEKFRFAVSWSSDGDSEKTALVRMGFHDFQMPKRSTTKIHYREGIDPDINQLAPGLNTMEDVVISRGVIINDPNDEFYKWISAVHNPTSGQVGREALTARASNAASNDFRKDVTIKMLDREGNIARQWCLFQAWPMHFAPSSDLNAGEDGDKAMESLTLAFEDFQEQVPGTAGPSPVSSSLP
jgi:phage tail-like protein